MPWPDQAYSDTQGLLRPPLEGVIVSLRTHLAPWLCLPVHPSWGAYTAADIWLVPHFNIL